MQMNLQAYAKDYSPKYDERCIESLQSHWFPLLTKKHRILNQNSIATGPFTGRGAKSPGIVSMGPLRVTQYENFQIVGIQRARIYCVLRPDRLSR